MLTSINISASEAKKIKYLNTQDVLISINEPDSPKHELSIDRNNERVLTVCFWDICAKREYMGNTIIPMNGDNAIDILKFIDTWKDKNFIIHCQAGISRSSAVAMYIHLTYGHELKPDFWKVSQPNPYVLGKLFLMREFMKAEKDHIQTNNAG